MSGGAPIASPLWAACAVLDGVAHEGVRFTFDRDGRIATRELGVTAKPGDLLAGTVVPAMGNAHSHAFHRLLRGRTHDDGGDFWQWRTSMYAAAASLDPARYLVVARAVFAEMLAAGYSAVGEFHYVHHQADGTPFDPEHQMELALAQAADEVGIRLVLLDTVYLTGGLGKELSSEQRAFGDGTAATYLARWYSLRDAFVARYGADHPRVQLGAALHSVRAVPAEAIAEIVAALPADVPLHIHVSEQPQENRDTIAATGFTPTELLDSLGALSARLSLVHATHLSEHDQQLIGAASANVVMCPSTEADLGDGIGPARELANRGAVISLGSDQNAVIDPLLEMRGLEAGERLASGARGRFSPAELTAASAAGGYRSLGLGSHSLAVGDWADLVEVDTTTIRTIGALPTQLMLAATASDVSRVFVGGHLVAEGGALVLRDDVAIDSSCEALMLAAYAAVAPAGASVPAPTPTATSSRA